MLDTQISYIWLDMIIRLNINLVTYWTIKNYLHSLPFLKDSRLFSICFCLALSGAAARTLASSSLIWGFRWVSWSARLWRKEGRKEGKHPVTQAGCYSDHEYTQISETETQWMKRKRCIGCTVMLFAYFSRVFFMSRSCGCRRWMFSSSCSFLSWQPCSFDTFSFSLLSIQSSCRKQDNYHVLYTNLILWGLSDSWVHIHLPSQNHFLEICLWLFIMLASSTGRRESASF